MSERKTIHRVFWEWDFEKEERWLNEMAMNGWALERRISPPISLRLASRASIFSAWR